MDAEKIKINAELAGVEFERWAEAMDLDHDAEVMDEDDRKSFDRQKRRIVREIMRGSLVINENGEAEFTPRNPESKYTETIVFHERTGASIMALDRYKKDQAAAKTYAMLGDICRVPPKTFSGLVGNDCKVCEALFALLMD